MIRKEHIFIQTLLNAPKEINEVWYVRYSTLSGTYDIRYKQKYSCEHRCEVTKIIRHTLQHTGESFILTELRAF